MIEEYNLEGLNLSLRDALNKSVQGHELIRVGAYNGSSWIFLGLADEYTLGFIDHESKLYEMSIRVDSEATESNLNSYQEDVENIKRNRDLRIEEVIKDDKLSDEEKKLRIEKITDSTSTKLASRKEKYKARQRVIDKSIDQLGNWIPFLDRKVLRITRSDTIGEYINIYFDGCELGLYWTQEEFDKGHKKNENKRRGFSTTRSI